MKYQSFTKSTKIDGSEQNKCILYNPMHKYYEHMHKK